MQQIISNILLGTCSYEKMLPTQAESTSFVPRTLGYIWVGMSAHCAIYPTQEFRNEEECLRHIATACPSYSRFSNCPPDTFVMPKPRTRFPCANCGKEHAKWNKCLEHMWICCPDVVLAQDEELEISRKVSSMRLNPHVVEFKSVFHDH
jgi:hypothetical protein